MATKFRSYCSAQSLASVILKPKLEETFIHDDQLTSDEARYVYEFTEKKTLP